MPVAAVHGSGEVAEGVGRGGGGESGPEEAAKKRPVGPGAADVHGRHGFAERGSEKEDECGDDVGAAPGPNAEGDEDEGVGPGQLDGDGDVVLGPDGDAGEWAKAGRGHGLRLGRRGQRAAR